MFTGLIRSLGVVTGIDTDRLVVGGVDFPCRIGDSVAVNGVCLTVVEVMEGGFRADVSPETWRRTNLGYLQINDRVNLEPALAVGDKLGGHFVSGHVDGLGTLRSVTQQDNSWWFDFAIPPALRRYVAEKGSVAINGVSLTIAGCADGLQVAVIPYTFAHTNLQYVDGRIPVNLEMDLLAKYVESLIKPQPEITTDFLKEHGYL